MIVAFIHGFMLAFGLILPLGVQNVFVFNQGAVQPRILRWLPVVAVAALCDTLLILLAVGGVSVAVLSLAWLKAGLVGTGVAFLGYMGWLTWSTAVKVEDNSQAQADWPLNRQVAFAMSVSLLNPHAILDTIGVIGTSSLAYTESAKTAFTLACILVSWVWFFSLAMTGRFLQKVDRTGNILTMLNKISAVIMWISAVYLLMSLI